MRVLGRENAVTVLAFHRGKKENVCSFFADSLPSVNLRAVAVDPYRYVNVPSPVKFLSPIPMAFWPSRIMQQEVNHFCQLRNWDAIVAIQIPAAWYALSWSIPRVLDIDTALSYQMRLRMMNSVGLASRLRAYVSWQKAHLYEMFVARRFQAVTLVSDQEVAYLKSMVHNTSCCVDVIPNGVDTSHNCLGLAKPFPHRLVYNGALGYSANYDAMNYFLSDVYPLIKREIPDISMAITGSTDNVDLSGLALDDSVMLTGYVYDVRIPVAKAAICVVPLREGGGTRLKILEAMALGTPVVTTSKGAEGLDVVDGEHCLIADSPAAFARQTLQLLRRTDLRARLVDNARRLVEKKYDWEPIGLQFARLIEEVVETYHVQ